MGRPPGSQQKGHSAAVYQSVALLSVDPVTNQATARESSSLSAVPLATFSGFGTAHHLCLPEQAVNQRACRVRVVLLFGSRRSIGAELLTACASWRTISGATNGVHRLWSWDGYPDAQTHTINNPFQVS